MKAKKKRRAEEEKRRQQTEALCLYISLAVSTQQYTTIIDDQATIQDQYTYDIVRKLSMY